MVKKVLDRVFNIIVGIIFVILAISMEVREPDSLFAAFVAGVIVDYSRQ